MLSFFFRIPYGGTKRTKEEVYSGIVTIQFPRVFPKGTVKHTALNIPPYSKESTWSRSWKIRQILMSQMEPTWVIHKEKRKMGIEIFYSTTNLIRPAMLPHMYDCMMAWLCYSMTCEIETDWPTDRPTDGRRTDTPSFRGPKEETNIWKMRELWKVSSSFH